MHTFLIQNTKVIAINIEVIALIIFGIMYEKIGTSNTNPKTVYTNCKSIECRLMCHISKFLCNSISIYKVIY